MNQKISKILDTVGHGLSAHGLTYSVIEVELECGHKTTINTSGMLPDFIDCKECNIN
jgi:hypothetical protein